MRSTLVLPRTTGVPLCTAIYNYGPLLVDASMGKGYGP